MNVAKAAIDALPDPSDRDLLYVALAEAGMIDFHDPPGWENINNLGKAIGTFEILAKNLEFDCVQLAMLWNTRWILNDEARIVGEGGGRAGVEVLTSEDDPGLENGGFGWTFNSNLELSNDAHGGSNALRTTEKWHHKAIPVERFTPDTHYVFSYWGKQTDPSKWGQAGITLYDGGVKTEAEPNTVDSTYKHARPPNVVRSPSPRTAERRPGGLS